MTRAATPANELEPADPVPDAGGAPRSKLYGDVFHSVDGALAQAQLVFLAGNGLPQRWESWDDAHFTVLETGFGLGVNFMATWDAWRTSTRRPRRLHVVSVDLHPVTASALLRHAPAPLRALAQRLAARWPPAVAGVHRLVFDDGPLGTVVLTLVFGDARTELPGLRIGADAIYLDGFSPERNPAMWSPALLKAVARQARPGATLATWCVAGAVRSALAQAGFDLQRLPGLGHKRHRLAGVLAVRRTVVPNDGMAARPREIAVVGAGLAGCAAAHALARRGWRVHLIDAADGPGRGASALAWGLVHPQVAVDDRAGARLSRQGCLHLLEQLAAWRERGRDVDDVWQGVGVWRALDDAGPAVQRMAHAWRHAPDWLQACAPAHAQALTGIASERAGLWWPRFGIASPSALCATWLDDAGSAVNALWGRRVSALRADGDVWQISTEGQVLLTVPQVLLANADGATALAGVAWPQSRWRGQLAWQQAPGLLRAARAGDGYLVPAPGGRVGVGSTYEADGQWLDEAASDAALRQHWERHWPPGEAPPWCPVGRFEGVRCTLRDRLPLAGAVPLPDAAAALTGAALERLRGAPVQRWPRQPGLHVLAGLGSRGLSLAAVLADQIAACLSGEPEPLPRQLAACVDPARFMHRALRRASPGGDGGAA